MNVDVPDGYNVFGFGGSIPVGSVIHMRRLTDDMWCSGTILDEDGTLDIVEDSGWGGTER